MTKKPSFKTRLFALLVNGGISIAVLRTVIILGLLPILLLCLGFLSFYIQQSERQSNDFFEGNRQLVENQLHKLFDNYEAETRVLTKQLDNPSQAETINSDPYINSTLISILNSYPELEGVAFRNSDRQFHVESRDSFNVEKFNTDFGFLDPTRRDLLIQELKYSDFLGEKKPLIILYRNLFDPNQLVAPQPSKAYLGTLFLFLQPAAIEEIIAANDSNQQLDYYILYKNRVIYTPTQTQKTLTFSKEAVIESYPKDLQRTVNLSLSPSLYLKDLQIITARNQSRQLMAEPIYWLFLFLSILFAIGIPLTIYFVIDRTTIRPLELLVNEIKQVKTPTPQIETSRIPDNELGILARKINQMLSDLFIYHERLTNAEIKRKDAELKALKSQIQPHYLYNTLEVIRMSAIINHDNHVAKMIKHLSNQLEYILRETNQELVPLTTEVANVVDYLELINVRYEGRIQYQIDIEPALERLLIPRLTLQPLVENAVKHGLSSHGNQGNISVSAYEDTEEFVIEILDDGGGMTKAELESLKHHMSEPSDHLGVSTAHLRLQDLFGPNAGIEISSKKNYWTLIRILIPKEHIL